MESLQKTKGFFATMVLLKHHLMESPLLSISATVGNEFPRLAVFRDMGIQFGVHLPYSLKDGEKTNFLVLDPLFFPPHSLGFACLCPMFIAPR